MANISFYPGPSRIYSNITEYIIEAYKDGVMSINHRSPEFMTISKKTKKVLKDRLDIPKEYQILFVSSATETWEIIAQSLIEEHSQHFYNGAFGEKWCQYTSNLDKHTTQTPFDISSPLPVDELNLQADCLCLTHCETSNGTYINDSILKSLHKAKTPHQLLAIDATSSMGGIKLPWKLGDVWYASVQKCFGLPAGLGVVVVSPKAVERAEKIGDRLRYNSLLKVLENGQKEQTHYTPNILNIYLLKRTQEYAKSMDHVHEKIVNRQKYWTAFLKSLSGFDLLIDDKSLRSPTVTTIKVNDPQEVKDRAAKAGFILGNGYGPWKNDTFRIANFPAIKRREIELLSRFLQGNYG